MLLVLLLVLVLLALLVESVTFWNRPTGCKPPLGLQLPGARYEVRVRIVQACMLVGALG